MRRTRYFVRRLIRPGRLEEPLYVFRILPTVAVEVYDVAAHAWKPQPLEPLYRWAGVVDGEIGVDEISESAASDVIRALERGDPWLSSSALVADRPALT